MQKYFGIGLTCGLLVASVSAQAFTGQQFTKDAKVGIAEARSIEGRPGFVKFSPKRRQPVVAQGNSR